MLYPHEDFIFSAMDDFDWDGESYEMVEFEAPGWLTADDPVFWCLVPAHLEDVAWLFRTAPIHQPHDLQGYPISLLEYYLRMEVLELLGQLYLSPRKVHDAICRVWTRVTKRRNLAKKNFLNHSSGPELEWLFGRDPDLPPSWEVLLMQPSQDIPSVSEVVKSGKIEETIF